MTTSKRRRKNNNYLGRLMNNRRVVVTGLGIVSSIGMGKDISWKNLLAGKSGISKVTLFDPSEMTSQIAGQIKDYTPLDYFDRKELRKIDRFIQFARIAADDAIKDSGLDFEKEDRDRIGVIIGSGIGGISSIEAQHTILMQQGARRVSPFFIPMEIINMAPGTIAIKYNLTGPNYSIVSACATGGHSIGTAMRLIQYGDADVVISGGAEAAITPLSMAGFCSMKALSTKRNDEPEKASRPFDKDRDGFILSEGSGILVLEELGHARARGGHIYAELTGFGSTDDAYHITAPVSRGIGAQKAMKLAMKQSNLSVNEIDYINAHGTSTRFNDLIETEAIKDVFGEFAYKLAISSTKSMTGHLLGASAGLEAAVTCLSIENSIIPPTINLDNPDEEMDLNYTANKARKKSVNAALSNSLGFGGHNVVLAFKKYE